MPALMGHGLAPCCQAGIFCILLAEKRPMSKIFVHTLSLSMPVLTIGGAADVASPSTLPAAMGRAGQCRRDQGKVRAGDKQSSTLPMMWSSLLKHGSVTCVSLFTGSTSWPDAQPHAQSQSQRLAQQSESNFLSSYVMGAPELVKARTHR